ncbi:MAG: SspB family protein [Caulobacterales bacterium]
MAEDLIGYDQLMQDALRSVVRNALYQAQGATGLPGRHHFYITFRTQAPGITLPAPLLARYPDEMTIVLEHQYWDLEVYQDRFRVILKFAGQPQPIVIPFAAITRFFDPSVKFGLQFEAEGEAVRRAAGDGGAFENSDSHEPPSASDTEDTGQSAPASVVSLDAFRKK